MTTSPDPQADRAATGGARPAGPVYGQEGAYATYRGDAAPLGDAPPPPTTVPPASGDAPRGDAQHGVPGYPQHGVPGYPQPVAPGYPTSGAPQGGYPTRPPMPRNDLAVWSLVLGLLGVLGCVFFTGVPAVVVGNNARRAVAAGEADNAGTATAGIVLGWVATGLGVLLGVLLVLSALVPLLFMGIALPIMGYR
ncbi:hypothetical protein Cfla_1987 [Cellulomonas flavigena DSM 20109]|uniref:DUF4190 domain-containing protein n=1 Tax=Cellulomonas flavigena (strain ATCC 482 / DSM 20109 / BCRC 11376 / JCM 18109 / NBRC 3775 / NCIMB 8073 / NRS 134) TaxID=446466 RepID=D5UF85_CELFN|nr:DUF4190 domain-containing protein [Cellulomonas flavigena]ADG74882.1 hypothetical protein Cfla_1987 [Cellulomonas flavigena DSM 20109]